MPRIICTFRLLFDETEINLKFILAKVFAYFAHLNCIKHTHRATARRKVCSRKRSMTHVVTSLPHIHSLPSLTFCRHALTQYYSCHMPLLCFVATNLPCLAYLVNYLGLLALDYFLSLLLFSLLHFLLLLLLHLLLLVGFWCCKVSNFSRLSSDWFGTIMFTYLNAACGMLSHSRRKSTWIFLADSPWQISQS